MKDGEQREGELHALQDVEPLVQDVAEIRVRAPEYSHLAGYG